MFQSTPANFTAGDQIEALYGPDHKTFQSTPANFTAGDVPTTSDSSDSRFQSTPANFTAGDAGMTGARATTCTFQSTPANFTAGDGHTTQRDLIAQLVSIHARQFHSGRQRRPAALVE